MEVRRVRSGAESPHEAPFGIGTCRNGRFVPDWLVLDGLQASRIHNATRLLDSLRGHPYLQITERPIIDLVQVLNTGTMCANKCGGFRVSSSVCDIQGLGQSEIELLGGIWNGASSAQLRSLTTMQPRLPL